MSHHRHAVTAPDAPAPAGPYSHAVHSGGLLFCSGQVGAGETLADQARHCLTSLERVCAAAGATLADAVRVGVFLTDMAAFAEVNEVYATFFSGEPPARTTVGVAALPGGAQLEMDAIVALPD